MRNDDEIFSPSATGAATMAATKNVRRLDCVNDAISNWPKSLQPEQITRAAFSQSLIKVCAGLFLSLQFTLN